MTTQTANVTNFALSDEHNLVRTSVRTMLQRLEPRRAEFRELARREKRFPEELWQGFADVGLLGCLVPEEYGGNGAGLLALTIGFEEVCANGFSPGLLLVDTKSKWLEKTPIDIGLSDELTQFQLFFDNVEVPADQLIGQEDNGTFAMFNSLNPERILAAAICTGISEAALRKAVDYAK